MSQPNLCRDTDISKKKKLRLVAVLVLNKCLKQIKEPRSPHTCTLSFELPCYASEE